MKIVKKAKIAVPVSVAIITSLIALLSVPSSSRLYLPIIFQKYLHLPIMGTELERDFSKITVNFPGGLLRMSTHWNPDDHSAGYTEILDKTAGFTGDLLLTIKGYDCHHPEPDLWSDYVDFALVVIRQLQSKGVNIIALEIWNEPDAGTTTKSADGDLYGCWGNNIPAGVDYAAFFNFIYPKIKLQYPDIKMLAGAISKVDGKFITGMLNNLIVVDAVSFHCHVIADYVGCDWAITQMENQTNYPLWLTETAVVCNDNCDSGDIFCKISPCENHDKYQQAHFVLLAADTRIDVAIWYCLCCNGWMNTDMLQPVYSDYVDWLGK